MKMKPFLLLSISFFSIIYCKGQYDSTDWTLQIQPVWEKSENDNGSQNNKDFIDQTKKKIEQLKELSNKSNVKIDSQKENSDIPIDDAHIYCNYKNILEKTFIFRKMSKQEEIQYVVTSSDELVIKIDGFVKSGSIIAKILDYNNNVYGEVEIEKYFDGYLYRVVQMPSSGKWRILITPVAAEGEVQVIFGTK